MVLVVNSGSSSLKATLFDRQGNKAAQFLYEEITDHHDALQWLLKEVDIAALDAVAHRVVHGGERFVEATRVGTETLEALRALTPLAPLHNPANIDAIAYFLRFYPDIPQIAVFDTAFHATMPEASYTYALDRAFAARYGIRRFGFHGNSHAYLVAEAARRLGKAQEACNLITLHLGNGASVCAVEAGRSVDTSMGMTPLEGLVMGTRCGDIDPGVLLYAQREAHMDADALDVLLNRRSGLTGLCGTNDMRLILARDDAEARLAREIYVRRICKYIGAYAVLLGRVDALVFSGGVGEHAAEIREAVATRLGMLGVRLDAEANAADAACISHPSSAVSLFVIPTDEALQIFREAMKVMKRSEDAL